MKSNNRGPFKADIFPPSRLLWSAVTTAHVTGQLLYHTSVHPVHKRDTVDTAFQAYNQGGMSSCFCWCENRFYNCHVHVESLFLREHGLIYIC